MHSGDSMYPIVKLAATLVRARFRSRLGLGDQAVLNARAGLTDIDVFGELNHARYLHYMELAGWDFSRRVGFLDMMRRNRWGVAVGGASVRYRRRIPFRSRFSITSELVCHDGRWFYFLQEAHSRGEICASALMKACATSRDGLVPASEVVCAYGREGFGSEMPDWVNAWIEAEGMRPWPTADG